MLPGYRVRLTCKDAEAAIHIMAKGLGFRGLPVELNMAKFERTVRVYRLPLELPLLDTQRVLSAYGTVPNVEYLASKIVLEFAPLSV